MPATRFDSLIRWAPRVLGLLVCLFLSVFALDAFEGKTFIEGLPGFLLHLAPMAILLGVVALSFRWEWVGGSLFVGAALLYAYWARDHLAWIALVGGPLLLVGVLFLASWARRRRLPSPS